MKIPFTNKFRATNVHKAFLLNAVATSFIVTVTLLVKDIAYEKFKETQTRSDIFKYLNWKTYAASAVTTFLASLVSFYVLYILFGFGGGMLVRK